MDNNRLTTCSRPGGVTVWVVLSLSVLIGVTALALDGGRVFEERRNAQAAADAAALAAGEEMYQSYFKKTTPRVSTVARAMAARYGYTNDGTSSTVTVNHPPHSGIFAGNPEYVEVVVRSNLGNTFGRIFTQQKMVVEGRSVARGYPTVIGLIALNPTRGRALEISGGGSIRVSGASIMVNSKAADAYSLGGNATVTAESHNVVGGIVQSSGTVLMGERNTGVASNPDPLYSLPPPDPSDHPNRATETVILTGDAPVTLRPGVYRRGIEFLGDGPVTLLPGVYIIGSHGIRVSGSGPVTGNGVVIYNSNLHGKGGGITMSGHGSVNLTAPDSGPYTRIAIFQQRGLNADIDITGQGNVAIDGVIYAPTARVKLTGQGIIVADKPSSGIVADRVQAGGEGKIRINSNGERPRAPDIRLVE